MFRRALRVLVVVAFFMAGTTTVAFAQTGYPPSVLGLALSPASGLPGSTVTVSGSGCTPGATVTIFFDNQVVGTTTADSTGAFSTTITIPAGATPGVHTISTSGTGCKLSGTFTVVSAAAHVGIAFSGPYNVLGLSEAGAGLAFLGAVLIFATRRRRELNRHTA